ncbi:MAG: hypothetical protein IAE95_00640 [Chitinophagaceae bacterium]|nr:hypothetical protein [Chitinophagaceae bacterium]
MAVRFLSFGKCSFIFRSFLCNVNGGMSFSHCLPYGSSESLRFMVSLPFYVYGVFTAAVMFTAFMLLYSVRFDRRWVLAIAGWIMLQTGLGLSGFYTDFSSVPPRFLLMVAPPVILIAVGTLTAKGRKALDAMNERSLLMLHTVRVPVEFCLLWLWQTGMVPQVMTFEGRNFDIICGLTAPVVFYLVYVRKVAGAKTMLLWNAGCLLLLANIVIHAVLAAPTPFQRIAFDMPNVAIGYFPFNLLPAFLVPAVLLSHVVSLRSIMKARS